MNLDLTRTIAMGLAAAALLTFGRTIGSGRSPASRTPGPTTSAAEHACVTVVAEHAACTLPPRHAAEHGVPPPASLSVR